MYLSQEVKFINISTDNNEWKSSAMGPLSKNINTLVVLIYNLFIIILYAHYFKYKK